MRLLGQIWREVATSWDVSYICVSNQRLARELREKRGGAKEEVEHLPIVEKEGVSTFPHGQMCESRMKTRFDVTYSTRESVASQSTMRMSYLYLLMRNQQAHPQRVLQFRSYLSRLAV